MGEADVAPRQGDPAGHRPSPRADFAAVRERPSPDRWDRLEEAKVRDLYRRRQAFLVRASVANNEKPVWLALHDVLFEAVLAGLPPREDRDPDAELFPGFVARVCKATGTSHFPPHGLRKRRGSLVSKQGYSLAEISERPGDTKVVTAEHYLYVLGTTPRSTTRPRSAAES
jgi:integrase